MGDICNIVNKNKLKAKEYMDAKNKIPTLTKSEKNSGLSFGSFTALFFVFGYTWGKDLTYFFPTGRQ